MTNQKMIIELGFEIEKYEREAIKFENAAKIETSDVMTKQFKCEAASAKRKVTYLKKEIAKLEKQIEFDKEINKILGLA